MKSFREHRTFSACSERKKSMYARVVTVQYQSGKLEEGFQMYRDSMVPASMKTQGFRGALGLADHSTGKAIAITLRETVADMQATESSGFLQEQFAKIAPLLAGTPTIEVYEVSVQELQQGAAGTSARVLTAMTQPEKIDAGMQIIRDSVLPVARQQPGFKGAFWLADRSTGKIMATTFWATEANLLAGESSGYYQAQIAKVAHLLTSQVVREAYQVDLHV
jgi:quinol monooxygenase YgiN